MTGGREAPPFSARLTKATGDGEQIEVAMTAISPGQLAERLTAACTVVDQRMRENNQRVLDAAQTVQDRAEAVYHRTIEQVRGIVRAELETRDQLQAAEGRLTDGTTSGAVHAAANP